MLAEGTEVFHWLPSLLNLDTVLQKCLSRELSLALWASRDLGVAVVVARSTGEMFLLVDSSTCGSGL